MSQTYPAPSVRFWANVKKSRTCWNHKVMAGKKYGSIYVSGRNVAAHRFSWELQVGSIPNGLLVLHKCDNPACVRPDHLFLGTHKDNVHDMLNKGRGNPLVGSKHQNSKLTERAVIFMRKNYITGKDRSFTGNLRELAGKFNVSKMTALNAIRGKTWTHVKQRRES